MIRLANGFTISELAAMEAILPIVAPLYLLLTLIIIGSIVRSQFIGFEYYI